MLALEEACEALCEDVSRCNRQQQVILIPDLDDEGMWCKKRQYSKLFIHGASYEITEEDWRRKVSEWRVLDYVGRKRGERFQSWRTLYSGEQKLPMWLSAEFFLGQCGCETTYFFNVFSRHILCIFENTTKMVSLIH